MGIGGLVCALSLAPRSVTLITKTPKLQGGSSFLAQGGMAVAIGPDDSPAAHAADTICAGAGLSNSRRTRQLAEEGFRLNLWEHAYIHPTSPLFDRLRDRAGDYLVWEGLVIDLADPEASRIFADYHEQYLIEQGVTAFKADECDRQYITDATPFNYPYCSAFPSGIDGDQMTQLYGYLYQRSIYSAFKRRDARTWGDVRATTALAAPLP